MLTTSRSKLIRGGFEFCVDHLITAVWSTLRPPTSRRVTVFDLIYNNPVAFAPGEAPLPSVVVIEFKRPERDDYNEDKSPSRIWEPQRGLVSESIS